MLFPSDRSIVATIGRNPGKTSIKAKELGADILELRIDIIPEDPGEILKQLKKLELPIIITNRMKQEGGEWKGSEAERISKLCSLIPEADAVDVEFRARDRDIVIRTARNAGKKVIISWHNFQSTPDNEVLSEIIKESLNAGADIAKLAVMPNSLDDVLRLLFVILHSNGPVCAIAMGEIGKHSRVIGPIYGSRLTYGYIDAPVAPGQLRIDELKYMLRLL